MTVRAWLALIEETDPATIAEVMGKCQHDADARDFFLGLAVGGGRGFFNKELHDDNP